MSNPFFEDWNTPYGIPPFDLIHNEHYLEAFERGFAEQNAEIDRIAQNQAPANFTNTIEALERSGALLAKTGMVFSNLSSSDTNDSLQAIELALSPKYAAHEGQLLNNQALFARVKQVFSSLPEAGLDADQVKLCEDAHTRFVRAVAGTNGVEAITRCRVWNLRELNLGRNQAHHGFKHGDINIVTLTAALSP